MGIERGIGQEVNKVEQNATRGTKTNAVAKPALCLQLRDFCGLLFTSFLIVGRRVFSSSAASGIFAVMHISTTQVLWTTDRLYDEVMASTGPLRAPPKWRGVSCERGRMTPWTIA